jgi:hypothetical protein
MATCPRCMGALTENHRCPRGRLSRVTDALSTLAVGALIGVALCYGIEERPVPALVLAAAALGSVLASALRQAVSGRSF